MLRWTFGAVACLIAGVLFLSRYFAGLPALDRLTKVEGAVTSADVETQRTRRMQSKLLAVRIGDAPAAYYPERLPDFERIAGAINPGDRVIAWVDAGQNNYIWQLDKGASGSSPTARSPTPSGRTTATTHCSASCSWRSASEYSAFCYGSGELVPRGPSPAA